MARSGGLFGGGGGGPLDLYGDLFTDEQKQALQQRELSQGLLGFAARLGAASAPSREPKGSFLGLLGQAAGGFASQGDEQALKGMEIAEKVRSARQERAVLAKVAPIVEAITRQLIQGGVPAAQASQIAPQIAAQAAGQPPSASAADATNAPPPPPGQDVPPASPTGPPPEPWAGSVPGQGLQWQSGLPWGMNSRQALSSSPLPAPPGPQTSLPPPPSERIGGGLGYQPGGYGWQPPVPVQGNAPAAPGPQTGLLPPLPGANPQMGANPGVGGGLLAGLPFNMAAGQTPGAAGPDLAQLASLMREAAGGGGDDIEMPFPTRQNPNKPKSAWEQGYTYDQPKVPYGQAPEDRVRPGGRPDDARLDALTRQYESGDRNIMQQVNATSTAGGYYQITNSTWRDIAPRAGIDLEKYPTAISAPREVQAAAAKALRETRGMQPWQSNTRLMAAVGGGLPDAGRVRVEPLGGEAAPAGAGGIAGTGVTPEALAALNAMLKLGGIKSDPFGSLLDSYYKSPGYIAEKARTEAQATKDVEFKMDPLILEQRKRLEYKIDTELKPKLEEAVQKLQSPILKEREQAKADIDRYSKALEQNRQAALTPTKATIFGPGGVVGTEDMTASEFARRQKDRADRIGKGDATFRPGDIVPTPTGAAPAEHEYRMTPQGALTAIPVPGTPAAEKAAEAASKKLQAEHQNLIARDTVVREVDNIGKLMESATLPTTGFAGSILQNLGGTSANDVRVARQTLESRLSRDALNAQRAASPTGAAFGNTSDADLAILRTSLVNLDQSQTKEQFKERLQILKQNYIDAVHGPGMSRLLPETQVLKTPQNAAKPASEIIQNGWRYDATTHKPIGPVQ